MSYHFPLIPVTLFLATAVPAQSPIRTLPAAAHNAWGNDIGAANGSSRLRNQSWFHGSNLPAGFVIREIALRRTPSRSSAAYTADLRIRLDNTSLQDRGLGPSLDSNLTANAVEVFNGPISVAASGPATSTSDPVGFVKLTTPFQFSGPNLIVDLDYSNIKASGPLSIDYISMQFAPTVHLSSSPNCGATLGALHDGAYYRVFNTTRLPPNKPLCLLIGEDTVGSGAQRYPMDLTTLGMPGCSLGLTPLVPVPLVADAAGNIAWKFQFTVPVNAVTGSVQAVHTTSSTPLGFAVTNTVNSVLGARGGFTTIASNNGSTGSVRSWNSGPVLLLR